MTAVEPDPSPVERTADLPRILEAMRRAVREAIQQHKRDGNPIVVWRDGKVVWLQPEEIPSDDELESRIAPWRRRGWGATSPPPSSAARSRVRESPARWSLRTLRATA